MGDRAVNGTMNSQANTVDAIEQCAAEWCVRRERADWNERDQAELDAWLSEATAHRVAWLRMRHGWQQIERLAAAPPVDAAPDEDMRPVPAPRVPRRPRTWRYPAAAAAAVILTLAAGVFIATQSYKWAPGFYETEIGARQIVALADGSRVELNTDTELRATIDETGRAVWLYQGEAFFDVTHDPDRAFVVHAGDRRVVVLGTQFSVRRDKDRVRVAVADGRVRVEREKPKKPAPPVVAERGETVIAKAETEVVTPPSPERIERQLAWRHGYLMFEKSTLTEAASEFNRYNTRKLVVDNPGAAGTRISGRFDANNLDAFVRLLQRAYGLQIEQDGDRLRVSG